LTVSARAAPETEYRIPPGTHHVDGPNYFTDHRHYGSRKRPDLPPFVRSCSS